uniref:Uncharacterized protein n=1 Tax=Corvus moneduloides TaxID=1196302 RepID=A0A8U7MNI0_CORMO
MTQSTSSVTAGTAVSWDTGTKTCPWLPGSGRQLRPAEPPGDADADADAEDEDSVNEVAVEDIRPRPQGSSPVYEYPIEEDYLKLQEENKKHSTDKSKQSHPQETMEVTLKTEAEAGASGFSVKGGGNEGIFIKKVLKESPASKIFSLREGDQLLSATIFFDNIKYEDALKILQYSEPYRVQFSLKRKIAVQEDLEDPTAQHKKERIREEKELSESIPEETLHVSGKAISEEDRETLIVSQRVGRSKRPKKDRLSWPKFQSIKNKKILRHRRSHSTSDAYEPATQDISPTSTDTESQFPQEVHTKEKKGSQRKLKFPSIGFRMHRSKTEQEKQKKEIKTTLISGREKIHKDDISLENPEILTVEYTTSPAYEIKTGEVHETLTKELKDMKNGIPSHVKQYPEVEISIKKEKDKEATSKFSVPEVPDITTEIPKPSLEIADLKVSPTKKSPQASSKSRKKKQKGPADKKDGESEINIDAMGHTAKGSVQVKGLEIGTAKAELQTSDTLETGEKQAEDDTQKLNIQKINFGISMPKRKETETDTTKKGSDVPQSVPEKRADMTSENSRNFDVKTHMPDAESEVSTWKIQMPSFKMAKTPKTDMKITREGSREDTEDRVKKEQVEEDGMPTNDKALNIEIGMKTGEKDTEGKESKFRLPKLKFPTFTWSTTKEETDQTEGQITEREGKEQILEKTGGLEVCGPTGEIKVPSAETEIEISKGKLNENNIKQKPEVQLPSPKKIIMKPSQMKTSIEEAKGNILISKPDTEIEKSDFSKKSKQKEEMSENTQSDIKAPKVDISLPSVDVTLPETCVDLQAPQAALGLEGEVKAPEKEAAKTKDSKFKMPKFGMPSFGWSSSREAKGTVAAEVDVSLKEPQVTVPSGAAEVDVTLPEAEIQVPGVEVTVETGGVAAEGEKGRFKMPSVKLPKVKAPHAQVSLPKADVSLPKGQEGEVALQGPEAEASLEVAAGKPEGGSMKIHMPKVKVPSVVFSKPTIKAPKLDADVSLPQAELKAGDADISIAAPDVKLPSVEGSLELQAPDIDLKAPSAEAKLELEGAGLKGKLKMPKFDKPKFAVSSPKAEAPAAEVSLPSAELDLPSATVTAAGEGPALGLKADVPGAKTEGAGWKLEKPSLKMPKADIKAPKVDISLPSVDVTLPEASVDLQAPEASLGLEGEVKAPEKEAAKTKDSKFKMPKFGMPSFGWSSSREAKGTVAAEVDVSLKEPQVTVPSGAAEVDVTLPKAEIQVPGVEVTVETATVAAEGEKGRFKMPSVKLPKVKAPHAQVSLPKADVSLPKGQEGEVALQGPEAEASLEVAAGKPEGGSMKIHMPKVKVPSVVFSKPTIKAPKLDADVSLPQAELKAGDADISIAAPDVKLPSVEGSLELQAPDIDLKAPSAEAKLELEGAGLKGKLKMPKFDKPKFAVSSPKAEAPAAEVSLPSAELDLPSATVTAAGEGPALGLKADVPGAKTEGAGWKLEKPSLKMPKADIKAPKVDISLPSVDVTLPEASVDLQAPEVSLGLEGEVKAPEKEAAKTKDSKFKMPKFGMPSFGWSSSREAKGTVAAEVDVSLKEPQVTVPSGAAEVDVTLPEAEIQVPGVEVTVETAAVATEGEKGRFKMPDVKMPSVKLPKVKAPHAQVSLPKADVSLPKGQEGEVALQGPEAEASLEVATGKPEGGSMKIHMPKVKVPSVVFSKPTIKAPKLDADVSLPQAELKAGDADISIAAPDVKLPSVEGSLELQAPDIDLKAPSAEAKLELEGAGLKGKLKMPKFDKPKFAVSSPKAEAPAAEVSLPSAELDLPSATVTAAGEGPALGLKADVPGAKTEGAGWKLEKPSLKMPKADIKAPKVDISLPSVDVTLPESSVDLQAPEASLGLEGEVKAPEKEAAKTKDSKFKMPKFGMPSFGWSSSREAKGTVAAEVDVSLKEPQVTVPSGAAEVDVTLPEAEIQVPGVEVTVETAAVATEGEKGRFKMPDVKMPSVKLPKVKAPHAQVSLPKADVSLPKGQEGEVALQGPEAEASLEVATGKPEGGSMKIHMPKVKVPSVVFSKPTIKAPKLDADVSLPQAELKAGDADISIAAPDVKLPSVEGSLELQAPDIDLKAPSAEAKLELEGAGLKGKLKMPKFDKPKFAVSSPKAEAPAAEVSLPSAELDLPSATVTAAGEGPALGLKADVPGAKTEGAGWKLEKPSLKMPKADIKAPKVDISLPSVDVTLPEASVDLQAPEASLGLEGEVKAPEKEAAKTKDSKFKMPKFGMPSFGWSSSREAKGTMAAEVDVSLKEPQVTVPSGAAEVDVTLPEAEIQVPGVEVTIETAAVATEGEKGRFKMPDVKMPSVKLPKVKAPHTQVSLPKADVSLPKGQEGEVALQGPEAEASLEVAAGKPEGGSMKIHMPKVKVPSVVFSKPTIKAPKLDADVSLPQAELKAGDADISIAAPDVKLPSVEGSLELQAPDIDLKAPSAEAKLELEGAGLKGKLKMPKFDKPKFAVSSPKAEAPAAEVSLPSAELDLPSATVTAAGEGPALGLKADVPGAKTEGAGWKLEKPSLKMPKADIKAPKVDISLPSVDVTLPESSVDLQAPEASLGLEGEVKAPEKEAAKTKDSKFKMPKFGMPSFGWSSSREAKGTAAAEVDVSLKEPQVTVPSGAAEVDVTLPEAEIQVPGVEVTVETAAVATEGEKGRFKMPDVKMPSVKLPKVKAPHAQVSLPKADVSLPKGQEGEVALQGPEAEASLEVAAGKPEGGGMKIHMPKVKVPSVVFSKPTIKAPKLDADVSLPQAELKAGDADISIAAPDVKLPSVEGSLELQAPDIDLKAPSAEAKLELEGAGLKGKLKMPKFDKPKFAVSSPKAEAPAAEVSLPSAELDLPSATVTAAGEGPALGLKADVPGAKTEGAGWKLEKPSLKMPKADIKAPKVDISLPSVDVTLPEASVDLQAPEASLGLEGEVKAPEKEAAKTKDSKFKMPKFGMPSFGWSSSREAKGTVAAEVDVSLKEPQVTAPSGAAEVDVTLPEAEIQVPGVEVTVETAAVATEGEKGRFKMPDIKMPSVKLPKVKAPHTQVSLPKADVSLPKGQEGEVALQGPEAEASLEVAAGKPEGGGMKIHMPKVKVPSVVFSKPTIKAPKLDADVSLPQAELKAGDADISIAAPDVKLPSVEGSLELQAPDIDLKAPSAEAKLELEGAGLKGKLKMPKFDKPKFAVSSPKAEAPAAEVSLPSAELDLPSATVTAAGEGPALGLKADVPGAKTEGAGWKLEKPSLKMPKADIKAPKVDISLPSVDVTLPESSVDLQAPEASLGLEGEVKAPEKEAAKTKDSKFKMPKFGMPSFGWSSSREAKGTVAAEVEVSLKEPQVTVPSGAAELDMTSPESEVQASTFDIPLDSSSSKEDEMASPVDENLSDFEILSEDGSEEQGGPKLEGKTTSAEISLVDTEITVKIPKFRKPKFRIRSKGKASESDIVSNMESEISKGRITSDMTDPDIEKPAQISDAQLGVKLRKPSLEVVLDAPTMDPNFSPMEVTLPKLEAEIHGSDLECKAEQEVVSGEKGTEEKENKFKSSKFKLPSFRWSPKKEAIAPSHTEEHLEGPTLSTLSGDTGSELTFLTPENQYLHAEFDTAEKDGEKVKTKKSQFTMPKISFPKIKGQKVQVSLPILETDVSGPKQEKEVVSVQKSEKGSSGEGAGLGIKVPKVTVPTSEFSKPEAKAPKIEMDISMPTGEVTLPTCEEDGFTLKSAAAADASLSTSDIKMITEGSLEVKSPDKSVERTSSEIAVGDVEIKAEGSEVKTKMSKFQMPKVGITLSKGKGSEKDVGQSKSEIKVPQLKATVEISDIAVEAPNLEVECGTGTETYSPEVKMTKTDSKASEVDAHLPSADISIPKTDSDIQDSDAAVKIKGEIKQDGDGEEKEGHFKMPKFKLPSFSWSPKKEASVKSGSGGDLEDQKLAVMSSRIDTEMKGTATDDHGSGPDLDLEISAGKAEQKSPIKKPQFVMPKISLSKIKVPKSQSRSPKVEADAHLPKTEIEGDDSIKIPDIEKSHPEWTIEGAQISIKLADTKVHTPEFSRIETEASKTEMTVSSAKIDASLTPSEGSFQQLDLNSTNEYSIQKTGIKLPKGEASVNLKSPDILTESSSVVDGRQVKLEGPEGKIKMPKFQKPKFGISLIKGKGPETEISSPTIEAELPQLKTTNEIADIAVGVPQSEPTPDMADPGLVDDKIKTPQALMGGIEDTKVDTSTQSVSKPEGVSESFEEKEIKLKEHEIKAGEVQTEEHQGWFKMPKFRIPAFGRSSLKEKKSDADIEKNMGKAQETIPSAKIQTETSIPESTFSLPHAAAEITIGKEGIQKLADSVKSSDVSLPKMEGDISLSTERTDSRVNIPKTETYEDVVKCSAEGHTSDITVSAAELPKSHASASETDKHKSSTNRFPTCTLTFPEHKGKSQDIEVPKVESSMKLETSGLGGKPSSTEITLDETQKKTHVSLPKEELDIQNKEAASKKGKIKGEVKIIGKDCEESQLKKTSFTTKGSEDGTYVTAKLEDLKVEVPTVKTDVKITRVEPEMKFQVKSVEKDVSAGVEVQVEDRAETSKIKAYKFKIPKFGMLHSEIKGFEDDTNFPKSEADSAPKSGIGTAEMQLRKPEGSIGLKSPAQDHTEASARVTGETMDQTQGVPEVSVRIPKLKIPRFTFRTLPIEADVLLSKVETDPKGCSTDIEVVQLQASSAIPRETPGALEGGIQKAKSKIVTLTEPDIKTAQMTATIESSLSSAGQDIHWSHIEGQEVSEKVEPEHVAIERCEIYTTEILKESEILSSEVKTATLGFSLLKTKLPESHSDLEVLVQQPSPPGGSSVRKPTGAGESLGVAAQRTASAELKLSDKPHHESEESRGKVSLTKLKTSAAEVKCSSKEESFPEKSPEGITAAPLSKDEDVVEAVEGEEKDITNEKEKIDSKRSPGRFKFWLPSIGFSSSGDETSTDAKPEIKKSVPEDVKPADTSDDSSKQAEKAGWFRLPKLGFTSPSKKAKSVDKEEVGHKEGSLSDEDSPTDKPDVFFDAQESLSPKEIGEGEKAEIDGASSIVTSSARTELILLEEEKDSKSNIVGDKTK